MALYGDVSGECSLRVDKLNRGDATMTHKAAMAVLANHSLSPNDLTLYDPGTQQMVTGSSFYDHFGVMTSYDAMRVYTWLGY